MTTLPMDLIPASMMTSDADLEITPSAWPDDMDDWEAVAQEGTDVPQSACSNESCRCISMTAELLEMRRQRHELLTALVRLSDALWVDSLSNLIAADAKARDVIDSTKGDDETC